MLPYQLRIVLNLLATAGWVATVVKYVLPYETWGGIVFIAWLVLMSAIYCMDAYVEAHTIHIPSSLEDDN